MNNSVIILLSLGTYNSQTQRKYDVSCMFNTNIISSALQVLEVQATLCSPGLDVYARKWCPTPAYLPQLSQLHLHLVI